MISVFGSAFRSWLWVIDRLLPLSLARYVELLEWTAAQTGSRSEARMPAWAMQLLEQVGIAPHEWQLAVEHFPNLFRRMAGRAAELAQRADQSGRRWFQGARAAARIFL